MDDGRFDIAFYPNLEELKVSNVFFTNEAQVFGQKKSEIVKDEYKKFIIDVAAPSEKMNDLNFEDYNSELCLQDLDVIVH